MKKYLNNNLELKKIILEKIKNMDNYSLRVVNYSSDGINNEIYTDLEVHILESGEFNDSVQVYGLMSYGDFKDKVNEHVKGLKGYKNTTYKYLCKHFKNVQLGEDFTC